MRNLVLILACAILLNGCEQRKLISQGERWNIHNNTNHVVEIKLYHGNGQQDPYLQTTIHPNESAPMPGGLGEIPRLGIRNSYFIVIFDSVKYYRHPTSPTEEYPFESDFTIGGDYEVSDCVREKRRRYCKRTYYITEEHYLGSDSLYKLSPPYKPFLTD